MDSPPNQEEPLDAARVVPYRQWSDPGVDNDQRLNPFPAGGDSGGSLWTAGLMTPAPPAPSEPPPAGGGSWLAGLIKEEPQSDDAPTVEAHWLAGMVRRDTVRAKSRSWLSGAGKDVALPAESNRRSWTSSLPLDEPESESETAPASPQPSTSWLAGLVKEEKRPAIQDIARLLLGDSAQAPTPSRLPESLAPPTRLAPEPDLRPAEEAPQKDEFLVPEIGPGSDPFPQAPPAPTPPPSWASSPPVPLSEPVTSDRVQPRQPSEPSLSLKKDESPPPAATEAEPGLARPQPSAPLPPAQIPPLVSTSLTAPVAPPLTAVAPPPPASAQPSATPESPAPPAATRARTSPKLRPMARPVASRDKVSFYRSLATMFEAGVPVFAIFEFLSREGESAAVSQSCRRMAQALVSGIPLPAAAYQEPGLFDAKAVRMLDVGYRGGQLSQILAQLAEDEEHAWAMKQTLRSQLTYPCGIALLTLAAVVLLPPLVLTDLLTQVVALTSKPPLLTQVLLNLSEFISSPWTLGVLALCVAGVVLGLRTPRGQALIDNLEMTLWFIPAVSSLWRNVVSLRFLRVFAMTYQAGLPATLGMELAASSTGSQLAYRVFPLMKRTLTEGGTLSESFAAGGFLPVLALESIAAGEMVGKVPVMLENTTQILTAEVQSRVEAVAKLIEPLVLACLGVFVGVFVLGCLLPIVELTSTL